MEQKHFYSAFNLLFDSVSLGLRISQKEELYRMLFRDIYLMANDDLYGNDQIRRITSGGSTIHRKAVKWLCTDIGFEAFRINIENICLSKLENKAKFICKLTDYLNSDSIVPCDIKQKFRDDIKSNSDYQVSRSVAGILLCLDHSDYICKKRKGTFFNVDFMRLFSDGPIPKYPKFITDAPDAAV